MEAYEPGSGAGRRDVVWRGVDIVCKESSPTNDVIRAILELSNGGPTDKKLEAAEIKEGDGIEIHMTHIHTSRTSGLISLPKDKRSFLS